MKSEFYVATVANAYRRALDELAEYGYIMHADDYNRMLEGISHRAYTEAYLDGENTHTVSLDSECTKETFKFIAVVTDVEQTDGGKYAVTVEMRNRFRSGDMITVLSPDCNNGKTFVMGEIIHAEDGARTDDAKLVQHIYRFECDIMLHAGDILLIPII